MALTKYRRRRDFTKTKEPKGEFQKSKSQDIFVIQKHYASRLHYDFRLQIGKVLKSWSVPKGVPKKTSEKKLAILTEDHPLEYAKFEGTIPKGEYGTGRVIIWDKGTFENIKKGKNQKQLSIKKSFQQGQIEVFLYGKRLNGPYALVNFKDPKTWLLVKMRKKNVKQRKKTSRICKT